LDFHNFVFFILFKILQTVWEIRFRDFT